ncbi:MAG: cyanophycinase [Candidatus Glassbacteria bacterium]
MKSKRGFIVPIGGGEEKLRTKLILSRFVEICGGRKARIVIIPTASSREDTGSRYESLFRETGVREAISLPFESRSDCEREDWLETLARADGVFLSGGNQLRLSTNIGGSPVGRILRERNALGQHVAGTSAGAAFLSEHMIAFGDEGPTPISSMVTLAPGLGLTRRVIIDQHFRQRDRLGRLLAAISYNPRTIGVGLDEDTAAFIDPDDVIKVTGSGGVTIVDPTHLEYSSMDSANQEDPVSLIGVRLHILTDGGTFNLNTLVAKPAESCAERQ